MATEAESAGNADGASQADPVEAEPVQANSTHPDSVATDSTATDSVHADPLAALTAAPIVRPSVFRWFRYAFGIALPRENSTWVLHDVTCRTWALRYFGRTSMKILPILVILLVAIPSSLPVRLITALTVTGGLYMYSFVNIMVVTDRRAVKAGYPFSLPSEIRSKQADDRHRLANQHRRDRMAQRRARRF